MSDKQAYSINVTSLVSHRTGQGMVQLSTARNEAQLTPAEARHLAQSLIEAAEAAEQDAFLVHFFTTVAGFTQPEAAAILVQFRELRDQQEGGT